MRLHSTVFYLYCNDDWLHYHELILRYYITKKDSAKQYLFSKIKDDEIYLYQGYLQDYSWKKELLIPKIHHVTIIQLKNRNDENIFVVCYL